MKTIVNRFFILIVTLLGVMGAFATPHPPSPGGKESDVVPVPPPPGLPIDDNILVLLILAIVFGIYIICKRPIKTKAPI
jgi:hypothetical protein